jgi:hypothetical protein
MTEPSASPPIDASSTAILVAVTELRGEVRALLAVVATHATTIDRHDSRLGLVENRLSVLETARAGDADHENRIVTRRTAFWGSVIALATIVGLIITLFISSHGG